MSDKNLIKVNGNINIEPKINNVRINNDIYGIGEAIHTAADLVEASGKTAKNYSEAFENFAHTAGNIFNGICDFFGGNNKKVENQNYYNGANFNIKKQAMFAVENMKDLEMKKSVFENYNNKFQQIDSTLHNHGVRINALENKVQNHEVRIGHLEHKVDLHSRQLANHENRIVGLEQTAKKHEN